MFKQTKCHLAATANRAALVALTVIAALVLPASALATNVTEWMIWQDEPSVGYVEDPGAPYANVPTELINWNQLHNVTSPVTGYQVPEPSALLYGNETFGVNLTFATSADGPLYLPYFQWEFIRQPGNYTTQQIPYNEPVALYNTVNHQYLVNACGGSLLASACLGLPEEDIGVSLAWSTTPTYQWGVANSVAPGEFPFANLWNTSQQGYLIQHGQTFGVNLGWIHAPFGAPPYYVAPTPLCVSIACYLPPVKSPLPVNDDGGADG